MATETQIQIVREAPELEKIRMQLLEAAKAQSDAPMTLPGFRVAGFDHNQIRALRSGAQGIGAFQPFMQQGRQALDAGMGALGESADLLRGSDTRGQFAAAQQAMNLAAQPIQQMGQSAQLATAGVPLIGQGAQGIQSAQGMANQFAQANMGQSLSTLGQAERIAAGAGPTDFGQAQGTLGQGIGALQGAAQMYDPSSVQQFMNPFQQQVIDESIRQINRQGDISRQNLQAQATQAGAFGGSREGVQRAELERAISEQRNAAIVGGLSQGFNQASGQAQQAFEQQQGRQLAQAQGLQSAAGLQGQFDQTGQQQALQQAQALQGIGGLYGQQALQQAQLGQGAAGLQGNLSNQLAGLSGMYGNIASQQGNILGQQSQLGQSMAQGVGNLAAQQFGVGSQMAAGLGSLGTQLGNLGAQQGAMGQTAQQLGQQDTNFQFNLGQQRQRQRQAVLDAERATTMQTAMQPMQNIAFLSDIYKGAPSTQMSMTQQSTPTPSPFQQIAGLATGVGATAKAFSSI